jgi:hypothetical protein
MSYHPGIDTPEFCAGNERQISRRIKAGSMGDQGRGFRARTTVMGMLGAFGKMNLTSSNLPLLRQFSARLTLRTDRKTSVAVDWLSRRRRNLWLTSLCRCLAVSTVSLASGQRVLGGGGGEGSAPVAQAVGHDDGGSVLFDCRNGQCSTCHFVHADNSSRTH